MLGRRRRRRTNIGPTLGRYVVLAGWQPASWQHTYCLDQYAKIWNSRYACSLCPATTITSQVFVSPIMTKPLVHNWDNSQAVCHLHRSITISASCTSQQTQNMCITFIRCRPKVFAVGPTLYKCYRNVLCLLGWVLIGIDFCVICVIKIDNYSLNTIFFYRLFFIRISQSHPQINV